MSPTTMRISRSMKPTYEILIIKVRIMILTIKKKLKHSNNNNFSNSSSHLMTEYNKNYNNGMSNTKNTLQDKPTSVQVTLTGTVNREQLFKIQEVLSHTPHNRDEVPPNEWPATGEYTKSFNKFWIQFHNKPTPYNQEKPESTPLCSLTSKYQC